jgi:RNA polymerase sigma factor (sigma-70 family)
MSGGTDAGSAAVELTQSEGEVASLVRRAATGDSEAWDALVARYSSLVWAVALQHGIGESNAADVVQSTWLRLLEHIDEIRDPARIGGWLATTARRESLRIVELGRRFVLEGDSGAFDGPDRLLPATDERLLAEERGRSVSHAVAALPPSWQSVLRLLMSDPPISYQEIGDQLGIPVGSIGPTRGRCMSRMRATLESPG